ncbi:MAG: fasciclin domain-containing protein, partial [Dehalococcoidia bacterium]|nr:fasciclin domain-containing protein [Dehalococcoidia bacterium]
MKISRLLTAGVAAIAAAALGTSAFAADLGQTDRQALPQQAATADLVDTAIAAGSFTTLVTAVQAAGLEATLRGPGPFTVFAPTDEAFDKLPAGTVEDLLKPENKAKLVSILTYHVVPGKV